jgi:ABC-2 type transport system permease protein
MAASIRGQMLYPGAFVLGFLSNASLTTIEFVGIWALFARFRHIHGWGFGEVALFYGVVNIAFAIADVLTRGFDIFGPQFVKTGNFDRILLRPRPASLQLMGYEFRLAPFGRMIQGIAVFSVAIALLSPHWGAGDVLVLAWSVAGGAALFFGILVLQATLAFWTVESLEIANTLTYGGMEAAQYPLDIYAAWFRRFLIYVVPIGCVSYFPIAAVLGRVDATGVPLALARAAPVTGFLFLALSFVAWRFGIRHYTSTGS